MRPLIFVLSDSEAAGQKFKNFLESLDPHVGVEAKQPADLPAPTSKAIDPIAVATLILSIPSAVLAVMDIADRIEKRRRAQKLIEEAKRLQAEHKVEVQIVVSNTPKLLAELTPDVLLDIAQQDEIGSSS